MARQQYDLNGTLAAWYDRVKQSLEASAVSSGRAGTLLTAMQNAGDALDAMEKVSDRIAELRQNPMYSGAYVLDQAEKMREKAAADATAALDQLQAAAQDVWEVLQNAWRPARPANVSDALVLDRKSDLTAIAEGAGDTPVACIEALGNILGDALKAGDADSKLTAYVIAGGPLDLWLKGHGVTAEMAAAMFAQKMGTVKDSQGRALSGPDLAPLLADGGAGTLRGFCFAMRQEIASRNEQLRRHYGQLLMILGGDKKLPGQIA